MAKRITIIGGGASGTLLAVNLIRHSAKKPLEINLIEKRSRFGRGVAYGTRLETHLLNVPAAKMGAFPDDLEHFHRWLIQRGHDFGPNAFVPRMLFGDYVRDVFEQASRQMPAGVSLRRIDDEVSDAVRNRKTVEITLRSGQKIESDLVALAFGNFAPPDPSVSDLSFTAARKYFDDPWGSRLYETIEPDDSILIIGTGLSMVDLAMHFHKNGHRGKISAISTRGMLSAGHKLGYTYPSFYDELKPMRRITDILKAVRRHIDAAEASGSDWRAVIDSLRPATQQIWQDLPVAEKRYFIQHLSRYWGVARHRMPPEASEVVDEMRRNGSLEILKGRLREIKFDHQRQFEVTFAAGGVDVTVAADALVNCIGAQSNFAKIDSDLVKSMLASGLIRTDALSLGLDATPDGRLIGADGKPSGRIFALGPALKGILFETTAIPEIRTQARDLALKLLAN